MHQYHQGDGFWSFFFVFLQTFSLEVWRGVWRGEAKIWSWCLPLYVLCVLELVPLICVC